MTKVEAKKIRALLKQHPVVGFADIITMNDGLIRVGFATGIHSDWYFFTNINNTVCMDSKREECLYEQILTSVRKAYYENKDNNMNITDKKKKLDIYEKLINR